MKKSLVHGLSLAALCLLSAPARAEESASERTAVDAALKRDSVSVDLGSSAAAPDAVVPGRAGGGPVEAKSTVLGAIRGATKAQSNLGAGSSTTLAAPQVGDGAPVRSTARPQRGRRGAAKAEDPQRAVLDAMSSSFASCLTPADAAVEGAAVLNASISPAGDVATVTTVTPGGVSPKAAVCFREVLSKGKFASGPDASVVQVRLVPRDLRATPAAHTAVAQN